MGVQIKICGITEKDHAASCAQLGVDAVGLVFYPPSPRYVTASRARGIVTAMGSHVCAVGVFVNASVDDILDVVTHCGLQAVQLHGRQNRQSLDTLRAAGVGVIQHVNASGQALAQAAVDLHPTPALVECGKGKLPGGNAAQWDWSGARILSGRYPFVVAGGLTPDNVAQAIGLSKPDAVDVSSGVEQRPGVKDMQRIYAFVHAVRNIPIEWKTTPIF